MLQCTRFVPLTFRTICMRYTLYHVYILTYTFEVYLGYDMQSVNVDVHTSITYTLTSCYHLVGQINTWSDEYRDPRHLRTNVIIDP
jgi:hypothetical protein